MEIILVLVSCNDCEETNDADAFGGIECRFHLFRERWRHTKRGVPALQLLLGGDTVR